MATPFEAPELHFEGPLRNPNLSEEADRELDRLVDGGVSTPGTAWESVTKKHGTPALDQETIDAARRVADESDDAPVAGPPKPGETDEQIRQRHRDVLRRREDNIPPHHDPDLNSRMLRNFSKGEYQLPGSEDHESPVQ